MLLCRRQQTRPQLSSGLQTNCERVARSVQNGFPLQISLGLFELLTELRVFEEEGEQRSEQVELQVAAGDCLHGRLSPIRICGGETHESVEEDEQIARAFQQSQSRSIGLRR